jgi:hypothetical protein
LLVPLILEIIIENTYINAWAVNTEHWMNSTWQAGRNTEVAKVAIPIWRN